MRPGTDKNDRFIGWNGIHLLIPAAWDARVSGQRHLVFEKDFQPQLQIRWERSVHHTPRYLQERLSQFAGQRGSIIPEDRFPSELQQFRDNFGLVTCYQEESGMVKGGICLCADCHTLVLFQLLSADPALLEEVSICLTTISCHNHSEILWRIQDFSLAIPGSFILKNYTFGAGLTRLSFGSSDLFLQTCRLGPADTRLSRQSLVEILTTLTDASDLEIVTGEDDNSCEGHRSPTIPKQIFFRFRREKPFVRAKIWYDAVSNRLLAVVLSSNRPIPLTTTHKICSQYEIVQEESRA
jgi:hypothetical protein